MEKHLQKKYTQLLGLIRPLGSAAVAFSGGVDSTLLLKAAFDALGSKAAGMFYDTVFQPSGEKENARIIAGEIGVKLIELNGFDIRHEAFRLNPENRCYHCKRMLFQRMLEESARLGFGTLIEGSNADDLNDFRPGKRALQELGIRSPLLEVKLNKQEIRELSKTLGLSTWDKDALSCLATRIPFHEEVNEQKLQIIDQIEQILRKAGFRDVRARLLQDTVSIEVEPSQVESLSARISLLPVSEAIRDSVYKSITVDPNGYRRGNLNPAESTNYEGEMK